MGSFDTITSRLATAVFRRHAASKVAPRSAPPPKHKLILYDFEASPWCRLVREQLTILDLNVHIRPCPRQDLLLQGAFNNQSRYRPVAAQELKHVVVPSQQEDSEKQNGELSSLTFPILVDETIESQRTVIKESYEIVEHLWQAYGQDVILPSPSRRPDQLVNSSRLPFPLRFLLLSGPSYLRCLPRCGLFRFPSKDFERTSSFTITLYQSEGCPYSRLVRELLCSLEIPYFNISCAAGSYSLSEEKNSVLKEGDFETPIMLVEKTKQDQDDVTRTLLVGHEEALAFLRERVWDRDSKQPQFWDRVDPQENKGQSNELRASVYLAFLKGQRAFVPPAAEE